MRLEKYVAPFRAGDIQDILAAGRTRLRPALQPPRLTDDELYAFTLDAIRRSVYSDDHADADSTYAEWVGRDQEERYVDAHREIRRLAGEGLPAPIEWLTCHVVLADGRKS